MPMKNQAEDDGSAASMVQEVSVTKTSVQHLPRVGSVVGYTLSSKVLSPAKGGLVQWEVIRSEADLKAFHDSIVDFLAKETKTPKDALQDKLNFPLKPYATGLELLPVFVLAGSYYVATMVYALPSSHALLVAVVISSLAFVSVLAIGLAQLPLTWSAPKRIAPLNEYLARVLAEPGTRSLPVTLALLEEPLRADWPARVGPIDLDKHDLPHASSLTEWWYYNAHVTSTGPGPKRDLSLFVCFFRMLKYEEKGRQYHSHALTWAIVDPSNKNPIGHYVFDVLLEKDAPSTVLKVLEAEIKQKGDSFFRRALTEVLRKGNVPLPDKLFEVNPRVSTDRLELHYQTASLGKDSAGRYLLRAEHSTLPNVFVDLSFEAVKPAVRHGDHGVVSGHDGDDMFYYCIPRCNVSGTISVLDGKERTPLVMNVMGNGWFDHEFGGMYRGAKSNTASATEAASKSYAWNWVACQLDDGSEVTAALLCNPEEVTADKKEKILEVKAVVIDKEGNRQQFDGVIDKVVFEPFSEKPVVETWNSVRTFRSYPIRYRLQVPTIGMDLDIKATIPDQEVVTLIAKPAFWEGRCEVTGTLNFGKARVTGLAFVERNGFDPNLSMSKFFKGVNEEVLKSVAHMYPMVPTHEELVTLVANKETEHYVDGVDPEILGKTLIAPVRLVADRGGKSWRSYASLACIDCVGGDSREFIQWIAMPEFLHVGSLLIDDIQDDSKTRRGGPCAHLEFGVPLTINAGTGAYFMVEQMLKAPGLTNDKLLQCYELYFAALRGGHAGQALDIYGNDYLMDDVVATGNAELLEQRILAIHRLKTAVPAGTLARMGAVVGGGKKEQIEAIGNFFEAVGLAFQIQDDVLNLRGVYSKISDKMKVGTMLKTLGEDITDGKVTMPVCKFMQIEKEKKKRQDVWNIIKSKPQDKNVVFDVITKLEEAGAIDACVDQANAIVDKAWKELDPIIPDSFPKMNLRAFGYFVNELEPGKKVQAP